MGVLFILRFSEMLVSVRMFVVEGKKMENISKKLLFIFRQSGIRFWIKMSFGKLRFSQGRLEGLVFFVGFVGQVGGFAGSFWLWESGVFFFWCFEKGQVSGQIVRVFRVMGRGFNWYLFRQLKKFLEVLFFDGGISVFIRQLVKEIMMIRKKSIWVWG